MTLKEKILNIINMYGNILSLRKDATETLFDLKNLKGKDMMPVNINSLKTGTPYLIKYNYNGNELWCPIITLEFKVIKNKNIIYAINLEYLPTNFKLKFMFEIIDKLEKTIENITKKDNVENEPGITEINFRNIYNYLKSFNMNYAITAYDPLKVKEIYKISWSIFHLLLLFDSKKSNYKNMKELYNKIKDEPVDNDVKEKLKELSEEYREILEKYIEDNVETSKLLRNFENKLKLFDNE